MVQYLHFRILKFPLNKGALNALAQCWIWDVQANVSQPHLHEKHVPSRFGYDCTMKKPEESKVDRFHLISIWFPSSLNLCGSICSTGFHWLPRVHQIPPVWVNPDRKASFKASKRTGTSQSEPIVAWILVWWIVMAFKTCIKDQSDGLSVLD